MEGGLEAGEGDNHLDQEHQSEEEAVYQPANKRLCLEYLGSCSVSSENSRDSSIAMDNSSEVVTKIAGLYAERLMSDVILVVGKY